MEGSHYRNSTLPVCEQSVRVRVRRRKVTAMRREIGELRETIAEIGETVDLLMQTRDVFPECSSLKETCKGKDLIGMLEGDVKNPEAFRQRIMND